MIVTRYSPTPKGDKNSLLEAIWTQRDSSFSIEKITKFFTKINVYITYIKSSWIYNVKTTWFWKEVSSKVFQENTKNWVYSRLKTLLEKCWFKEELSSKKEKIEQLELIFDNIWKNLVFSQEETKKKLSSKNLYSFIEKIGSQNWYLSYLTIQSLSEYTEKTKEIKEGDLNSISVEKNSITFFYKDLWEYSIDDIQLEVNWIFVFNKRINLEVLNKEIIKGRRTNEETKTIYTVITNTCNELNIKEKLEKLWIYSSTEVWCTWTFSLSEVLNWKYTYKITRTDLPTD